MNLRRSVTVAAALGLLVTPSASHAFHEIDQEYRPSTNTLFSCPGSGSLFQSFTPSVSPLVAFDLFLNFAPPKTLTARVRADLPTGPILATVTTTIDYGGPRKTFVLPAPVAVNPGFRYVLELVYSNSVSILWEATEAGTYPGGHAYGCGGGSIPHADMHFATYTEAPTCVDSELGVCLNQERFRVSATFRTSTGASGAAHATGLTAESGYLWFFSADNVEAVIKVLDGCAINDRFWIYAAGLTDVEVELLVEDTETGERWTYSNPLGREFPPVFDVEAFATCP